MSKVSKGYMIIKPHPREDSKVYNILTDNFENVKVVGKTSNLDQSILASDIVITVSSTAGLWAMAYGKPLIITNYFSQVNINNILEKMAITVNTMEALVPALNQILMNKEFETKLLSKQSSAIYEHLYHLDGCAAKRIARLVMDLAKNNQRQFKQTLKMTKNN